MGCTNSKVKQGITALNLDGIDIDSESTRSVTEFPFYDTRLKQIDYQAIIEKGENWTDDTFPANTRALLDPYMMK